MTRCLLFLCVLGVSARGAVPAPILLDDAEGRFEGTWAASTKQASFAGAGYRHDENHDQGRKTAVFTPDIPTAGDYEVRVIYSATGNRATNVKVTIQHAKGSTRVLLNEREECFAKGVPRAVGRFRLEPGKTASLTLSNEGADGFVVVDAVQFVPVAVADEERSGARDAGFKAVKVEEPKEAAESVSPLVKAVAVMPLTKVVPGKTPRRRRTSR